MPEQVSRFRRDDKQTCQAREYGSLDNLAAHVEYVLARCVRQAEEISKKVRAFRSLPARLRPTALRELKDNIKALETGVVRHGQEASVFTSEMRGLRSEQCTGSVQRPASTQIRQARGARGSPRAGATSSAPWCKPCA